jgi:hypothetical protein
MRHSEPVASSNASLTARLLAPIGNSSTRRYRLQCHQDRRRRRGAGATKFDSSAYSEWYLPMTTCQRLPLQPSWSGSCGGVILPIPRPTKLANKHRGFRKGKCEHPERTSGNALVFADFMTRSSARLDDRGVTPHTWSSEIESHIVSLRIDAVRVAQGPEGVSSSRDQAVSGSRGNMGRRMCEQGKSARLAQPRSGVSMSIERASGFVEGQGHVS